MGVELDPTPAFADYAHPERLVRGERIKMPRHEVYGILAATVLLAPCNWALRALFRWLIRGPRPGLGGQRG